jgi:hypothetical protein
MMVVAAGAYGMSFERRILHGTSRRMPVLYYPVGNVEREKGKGGTVTM